MTNVFIDGSAGTTGLRIYDRLITRDDISLVTLPEEIRKDTDARKDAMNNADIVFLCLPDDAAKEAATFVTNPKTVVIDTSTAHRTSEDWTYGFAELSGQYEKIKASRQIANPGCHASGFISLVAPLVQNHVIAADTPLSCFSLTGYSGGGKKMIADYEAPERKVRLDSAETQSLTEGCADSANPYLLCGPRMYGISQQHKHIPEMVKLCGLEKTPVFCPIVADFYSGMEVTVSLFDNDIEKIRQIYKDYYNNAAASEKGLLVHYDDAADESGFVSTAAFSGRDDMQISVYGNDERILLVSRFDNLGKGASGAAIQNMNLVLDLPGSYGLIC